MKSINIHVLRHDEQKKLYSYTWGDLFSRFSLMSTSIVQYYQPYAVCICVCRTVYNGLILLVNVLSLIYYNIAQFQYSMSPLMVLLTCNMNDQTSSVNPIDHTLFDHFHIRTQFANPSYERGTSQHKYPNSSNPRWSGTGGLFYIYYQHESNKKLNGISEFTAIKNDIKLKLIKQNRFTMILKQLQKLLNQII